MAEKYNLEVLKVVVAQICTTIGYTSIQNTPLELLVDIFDKYMRELAVTTNRYAELYNRTSPNLDDLALAFTDMNINLNELEEYVQNVESVPSVIDVPKFPIPKESHLNFLKPGSNEILSRPVHIHEHLPPIRLLPIDAENIEFTENESEIDLVDVVSVNNTTPSVTSEIISMENNINDMEQQSQLQTNPYSSKKTNEISNNSGPNFNESVKRFLVENDLRPTREITSVMMTTSGFISPAREGKLPDSKVPVIVDDYKTPVNQFTTIQSQFPSLSSSFVSSTLTTTTSTTSDLKTPTISSVSSANALHGESQFFNNSSNVEGSKPEKIKKKKLHDKERKKLKNQKTLQKSHSMGHQHPFGSNIDSVPGNEKHNNFLFNANTPMIGSKKNRNVSTVDSTGGPLEIRKMKNKQMDVHFSKKRNKNIFFPSNNNDKSSNLMHKLGRKNKHKQSLMKPKHLPHMFENDVSEIKNNEINRAFSKNNIQTPSQGLQHSSSHPLASNFETFGNQFDDFPPTRVSTPNIGSSNAHSISQSFSQSFPSEKLSTEPDRQKLNIFKKLSSTTVASNANVGSAINNKDTVKNNDDVIILTSDDQTFGNSEEFGNVKKRNKTPRNSKHSQNEVSDSKFSNIPNNSFGSFNSEFNYDDQFSPRKNMDTQINLPRTPDIVLNTNSNNTNLSGSEEIMPAPLLSSSGSAIVTPTTKEKKKRSKKEKKKQRLMDIMDTEPPPPFVVETAPSFPFYEKPSISPFLLANNSAAAALGLQPPPRVGFGDIMNFSAFQRFPTHQNFGSSFHKQQDDNAYTMSTYTPQGLDSPLFASSSAQMSNAYETSDRIKSNRAHDSDLDFKSLYDKSHCNVAPLIPPSLILHDSLSNQLSSPFLDKPIHLGESAPPKTSTKQETKTKSRKSNKNQNTISNLGPDGGVDNVGGFTGPHKSISKESISTALPGSFMEDNDSKPSKRNTQQLPTFSFWDNNDTRKTESVDNGALITEVIDVDVDSGDDSKIVAIPVGKNKGDKKKLKKKDKELIKSKKKKDKKEKIKNKNRVEDIKKDKKEKRLKDPKDKMSKKEKKERKKEKERAAAAGISLSPSGSNNFAGCDLSTVSNLELPTSSSPSIIISKNSTTISDNTGAKNETVDNQYSVPKLTLKLSASPRPNTPEGHRKITIKPIRKENAVATHQTTDSLQGFTREASPELAKISALVTRPPKQNKSNSKYDDGKSETDDKESKADGGIVSSNNSVSNTVLGINTVNSSKSIENISFDRPTNTSTLPEPGVTSSGVTTTALRDADGNEVWICPACAHVDDGTPMIGCDGCDAWYHWVCVGIQVPPDANEDWYCRVCINKKQASHCSDKKKKRKKKDRKEN